MRHAAVIATALLLTIISCSKSPSNESTGNTTPEVPPSQDPGGGTHPFTDPAGKFITSKAKIVNRVDHSTLLLADGRVLIGGGDIFDPSDPQAASLRSALLQSYFQVYDPIKETTTTLTLGASIQLSVMSKPLFMEIAKNQILVFPSSYTNTNGITADFAFNNVLTLNTATTGNQLGFNGPMSCCKFNVNAFNPVNPGQALNFGWLLGKYNESLDFKNTNCILRKVRPDKIKVVGQTFLFTMYMPMQGYEMGHAVPAPTIGMQTQMLPDASLEFIGSKFENYNMSPSGSPIVTSGMQLEPDYYSTGFHHVDCIDGPTKKYAIYKPDYTLPTSSDFLNEDYYVKGNSMFIYTYNTTIGGTMDENSITLPIDATDCSYGWVDASNAMLFSGTDIIHVNLKTRVANLLDKKLPFSAAKRMKFASTQAYGGAILINKDNEDVNAQQMLFLSNGDTYKTDSQGVSGATFTTLPDGKILIAGGACGTSLLTYVPDYGDSSHIELPVLSQHQVVGHPLWMNNHSNQSGLFRTSPVMDDSTSTSDATIGGAVFSSYFLSEEKYLNANDGAIPLKFYYQGRELLDNHTGDNAAGEITLSIQLHEAGIDATSNVSFTAALQGGRWLLTINDHKGLLPWHQSNDGGRISEPVTITATQSAGPGHTSSVLGICKTAVKIVR